jgi:hypothetical protein
LVVQYGCRARAELSGPRPHSGATGLQRGRVDHVLTQRLQSQRPQSLGEKGECEGEGGRQWWREGERFGKYDSAMMWQNILGRKRRTAECLRNQRIYFGRTKKIDRHIYWTAEPLCLRVRHLFNCYCCDCSDRFCSTSILSYTWLRIGYTHLHYIILLPLVYALHTVCSVP